MSKLPNSHSMMAFLAVAEEGSINAAAEKLHVSQPALTRTIRELEEQVGTQLFDRNPKGVTLTPFGQLLVGHARRLRSELEALARNARSYRANRRGHLAIGAVPVHPVSLVAKAIADIQKRDNLEVGVIVGSQLEMIALLRAGKIELVLGPLLADADIAGLHQELINQEGTEFYCRPNHPLATKSPAVTTDLGTAQWVLAGRGNTLRTRIDEHFMRAGLVLDVPIETEDVNLRRSIVAQSDLISAFPSHHVFNEVRTGTLFRIDYAGLQEQQAIGCIRMLEHTPISRRFIDALRMNFETAGLLPRVPIDQR